MIQYRKILELYFSDIPQRTISTSVRSSINTVSDVIQRAEKLGLERLSEDMCLWQNKSTESCNEKIIARHPINL